MNDKDLIAKIAALAEEKKIGAVIMGDTRSFGGAENPVTPEAENFARELGERLKIRIENVFEALSSVEASRNSPKGSGHDDSAAAAFILQRFLDMRGGAVKK